MRENKQGQEEEKKENTEARNPRCSWVCFLNLSTHCLHPHEGTQQEITLLHHVSPVTQVSPPKWSPHPNLALLQTMMFSNANLIPACPNLEGLTSSHTPQTESPHSLATPQMSSTSSPYPSLPWLHCCPAWFQLSSVLLLPPRVFAPAVASAWNTSLLLVPPHPLSWHCLLQEVFLQPSSLS